MSRVFSFCIAVLLTLAVSVSFAQTSANKPKGTIQTQQQAAQQKGAKPSPAQIQESYKKAQEKALWENLSKFVFVGAQVHYVPNTGTGAPSNAGNNEATQANIPIGSQTYNDVVKIYKDVDYKGYSEGYSIKTNYIDDLHQIFTAKFGPDSSSILNRNVKSIKIGDPKPSELKNLTVKLFSNPSIPMMTLYGSASNLTFARKASSAIINTHGYDCYIDFYSGKYFTGESTYFVSSHNNLPQNFPKLPQFTPISTNGGMNGDDIKIVGNEYRIPKFVLDIDSQDQNPFVFGDWNDQISSIQVRQKFYVNDASDVNKPELCSITLYDGANFTGDYVTLTGDSMDLDAAGAFDTMAIDLYFPQ